MLFISSKDSTWTNKHISAYTCQCVERPVVLCRSRSRFVLVRRIR